MISSLEEPSSLQTELFVPTTSSPIASIEEYRNRKKYLKSSIFSPEPSQDWINAYKAKILYLPEPTTLERLIQKFNRLKNITIVAIDGAVQGRPQQFLNVNDNGLDAFIFDHHTDNRFEFEATCLQIKERMSDHSSDLWQSLRRNKNCLVIAVGADQDAGFSWIQLKYPQLFLPENQEILKEFRDLCNYEAAIDSYGYLPPTLEFNPTIIGTIDYLALPYLRARENKTLYHNPQFARMVLDQYVEQFTQYFTCPKEARGELVVPINSNYQVLKGQGYPYELRNPKFSFITEETDKGRWQAIRDGITAFAVRLGPGVYTLAKTVERVDVHLLQIFEILRNKENLERLKNGLPTLLPQQNWGGSHLIGGSPRVKGGTILTEAQIFQTVVSSIR